MTSVYFWLGIAVIGLMIGMHVRKRKRTPGAASGRLKTILSAIGSPLEYALMAVVVYFLWRSGVFDGPADKLAIGFFAMLVVPIVIILAVFVKLGERVKKHGREEDD